MYRTLFQAVVGFVVLVLVLIACSEQAATLPPDPGEAGKATLEGIDSDRDGVRDDVQRYIHLTYPNDEPTIEILTDHARLLRVSILETHDDAGLIALEQHALELTFCLAKWRPEEFNEDYRQFLSIFFNTPERFEAEMQYRMSLPTATYEVDDGMLENCGQEVRAKSISTRLAPSQAADNEIIFFVNGVWNEIENARISQIELHEKTGRRVALLHNRSKGTIKDLIETAAQKYGEPVQNWREWLFGTEDNSRGLLTHFLGLLATAVTENVRAEDLAVFQAKYEQYKNANFKIVVVAHSQGNLFANELYDMIDKDPKTPKRDGEICGFDVVGVATPANRLVGSEQYTTHHDDTIINLARKVSSAKPGNERNSIFFFNILKDLSRHKFLETYLRGDVTGPRILENIEEAFDGTPFPEDCNEPPEAVLTVTPKSGEAPLTVTASASASTDDGEIVNYTFDFSDGEPQTGAQSSAQHVYEEPGAYTVSVTVTDDTGKADSATETVEVLGGEYIGSFTYEYTFTRNDQPVWTGTDCSGNNVTTTSSHDQARRITSSATIVFVGGGSMLRAISVQGGSHTETHTGHTETPITTNESSYSSTAGNAEFVPPGRGLYIQYRGSYQLDSSATYCGETAPPENTSGERFAATQFYWDGSLSGTATGIDKTVGSGSLETASRDIEVVAY